MIVGSEISRKNDGWVSKIPLKLLTSMASVAEKQNVF